MTVQRKRRTIFYFEDDVDCINEVVNILKEQYDIILAAHWPVIKIKREFPFDLVIIDLMIHRFSIDESGQEVENISFEGISWKRTGVDFLKRIRIEEYVEFGFSKDVPVIIASAVVDYNVKQEAHNLKISHYIEKPFTLGEIQEVIRKILAK